MSVDPCCAVLNVVDRGELVAVSFPPFSHLNEANARSVGAQLLELVDQPGRRELFLDLANVDYVTSTALGQFLALHKKLHGRGGRMVLAHCNALVREVFAVTHLDRVFEILTAPEGEKISA
jgi:anti-anti-sigma factor